jgi:hypothetical protein
MFAQSPAAQFLGPIHFEGFNGAAAVFLKGVKSGDRNGGEAA